MKHTRLLIASIVVLLAGSIGALAQDKLSAKYEGTAKMTGVADSQITLELKNEAGKITGQLNNGTSAIQISEGSLQDGKLTLKLGEAAKDGVLTAKVDGDNLVGEWISGTQKKIVELKKAAVAAAATASTPATVNLAGQWDAVADAQGQPFPFLLTLKIDGEKVSGSSSSQLGESNISSGTWKDGHLSFQLDGSNGTVSMTAVIIDGKLSGEFDYAGQLQGKWVAVKKN